MSSSSQGDPCDKHFDWELGHNIMHDDCSRPIIRKNGMFFFVRFWFTKWSYIMLWVSKLSIKVFVTWIPLRTHNLCWIFKTLFFLSRRQILVWFPIILQICQSERTVDVQPVQDWFKDFTEVKPFSYLEWNISSSVGNHHIMTVTVSTWPFGSQRSDIRYQFWLSNFCKRASQTLGIPILVHSHWSPTDFISKTRLNQVYCDWRPDTLTTLTELPADESVKNDCLVILGDFNEQLPANVPGVTGKWANGADS